MKSIFVWFAGFSLALAVCGCQPENSAPTSNGGSGDSLKIVSLAAAPETISVGNTAKIAAQIKSDAAPTANYSWKSDLGFIIGSGATVEFGAESCCTGLRTITCTVTDGKNHTVSESVHVLVQ